MKSVDINGAGAMEETFKHLGERAAWSALVIGFFALIFYPFRRWLFPYLRKATSEELAFRIYVIFRNIHITIGILAITAAFSHGFLEYSRIHSLTLDEWIGLVAVIFLCISAIQGALMAYKTNNRQRAGHMSFLLIGLILMTVHIVM